MSNISPAFAYGICVSPFNFHYLENLIGDMSFKTFDKDSKLLQRIMERINSDVYQQIRQQLRLMLETMLPSVMLDI